MQPSFLGGEWSAEYQGRTDDPHYKIAMNISVNGFPMAQGAWKKRSGFRRIAATYDGNPARTYPFNFGEDFPFLTEWSEGKLRIYSGDQPVLDSTANLISVGAVTPMTIFVDAGGTDWATGDQVVLIPGAGFGNAFGSLPNQQFVLTALGSNSFSLTDPQTGADIDGSQIDLTGGNPTATIGHILTFTTPYVNGDWYDVFPVMFDNQMFLFHGGYYPYVITATDLVGDSPHLSSFTFDPAQPFFDDGPYFDPVVGQTATVSGISGTVTMTLTGGFGPNQSVPTAADVGRMVRLYNTPDAWDAGTQYSGSSFVFFNGLAYGATVVAPTIGLPPDQNPAQWAPNPSAVAWGWGFITAVLSDTELSVRLAYNIFYANTITIWRLGVVGDPLHGNPTCGAAHEGRLWMFRQNELYGSQSAAIASLAQSTTQSVANMWAPTVIDGTVTDANGITYVLQSGDEDANNTQWGITSASGMVLGTTAGEWVVKASQLDDPITPTSIQARRVTRYRVYKAKPVQAPLALIFIQKYQRKTMEFLADVFTGRYVAPDLSVAANHVSLHGLEEVVYQEETSPCVWTRDLEGNLAGCTYRRTSAFVTEAPAFVGWHRHTHGQTARSFSSIAINPSPNGGVLDSLYVVTMEAGVDHTSQIERMTKTFELSDTLFSAWFLDNAQCPSAIFDEGTGIKLYGFYDKAGLVVQAWLGGQFLGDYTVDAQGAIVVPYTSTFTPTFIQNIGDQNFGEAGTTARFAVSTTPARSPNPQTMGNFAGSMTPAGGSFGVGKLAPFYAGNALFTIAGSDNTSTANYSVNSYNASARSQTSTTTGDTFGFGNTAGALQYGCFITDPSGNILIALDSSHQGELMKVDPSDMSVISSFGVYNADTDQDFANAAPLFNGTATIGCAAGEFLVTTGGIETLTCNMDVIDTGNMKWTQAAAPTIAWNAAFCRGRSGLSGSVLVAEPSGSNLIMKEVVIAAGAGDVFYDFILALQSWSSGATYQTGDEVQHNNFGWKSTIDSNTDQEPGTNSDWTYITNPDISLETHGTVHPADVDPTWTTMQTGSIDLGFDQTDGNAILWVSTADTVTNKQYLIKVNGVDAAVMWAIPVAGTSVILGLGGSRIVGGQLGWGSSTGVLYSINTLAGTITSTFSPSGIGLSAASLQSYDAITGVLYAFYNYNAGTSGAPTQLSGTPSTFDEIGVYTPGTSIIGNTFTLTEYPFPAVVGFSYEAQGQLLRDLDPGPGSSGAQLGPALGKKRRTATYAMLLSQTQVLQVGTDFTHLYPVPFGTVPGGTEIPLTQLFSGVVRDTLGDDSSFDGMLCWASTQPYPVTVVAAQTFIDTSDQ
jgi:hypothetical protein